MGELGSAEPSPGFAARVRQQIEAPPWWSRLARALFLPTRVKVPIQALALALVAFTAVMLYQRSPELKRQADVYVPAPPPAGPTGGVATPQRPPERAVEPPTPVAPGPKARVEAEKDRREASRGRGDEGAPPAGSPAAQAPAPAVLPPSASGAPGPTPPAPAPEEAKPAERVAPAPEFGKAADTALKAKAPEPDTVSAGRRLRAAPAPPDAPSSLAERAPAPATAAPALLKKEAPAQSREGQVASLPIGSADELYSAGLTEFARQSYDRAADAFRAFIAQNPRDTRVPDARFYLADSQFAQQRYAEAIPEYEALIRQFPDSRRVPAALVKQAQARLALGDQAGCQVLRDVAGRFPRTREAAQAHETLAARCP
jgi:tol-pal system protein YbgF